MLKGLDRVLTPDLLFGLASMGHGDEIVLADRNFPAVSTARRLIVLAGIDVVTAARAILTVLPRSSVAEPGARGRPRDDRGEGARFRRQGRGREAPSGLYRVRPP